MDHLLKFMVAELTQSIGLLHHFVSKSRLLLIEPQAEHILLSTILNVAFWALHADIVLVPPGAVLCAALEVARLH
jgi:hypothetical protein